MTTQTPAIVIPGPRRGPGRRLSIGLAAAALAVLVGAGLWQASCDGGTETATPPAVAVERSTVARSVESAPTYYLVGTAAEADAQRALFPQLGVPAPLPEVVTVATTAEATAFFQAMADQNGLRIDHGLAAVTVVDLRAPAASLPPLEPAPVSDAEMYQRSQQAQGALVPTVDPRPQGGAAASTAPPTLVYLVSTPEAAAALRAGAPDALVVVWGTEEAVRAIDDFEASNLRLVDRRVPPAAAGG